MRTLKIICLFFCVSHVVLGVYGACYHSTPVGYEAHFYTTPAGNVVHTHTTTMDRSVFAPILSFGLAVFWACAFYGIHKKALLAWKLGWGVIAVGFSEFLIRALSSIMRTETAHPWIASAAVIVVGSVVALYWSFWWYRQKSYFAPRTSSDDLLN